MSFNPAEILVVLVIFQLVFTSVFLFTHRKGRVVGNRLLGFFFLAIGLDLLDNLLLLKGIYSVHPAFGLLSAWLLLLFGPLLYLYTQSVLYQDFRWRAANWLHFAPFAVLFAVSEIYWLGQQPADQRSMLLRIAARQMPQYQSVGPVLIFLQFFGYMAASKKLINRYRKAAGEAFSDYRRIDIRWLSNTLLFFTVVMMLAALNSAISLTALAPFWWPTFLGIILLVFGYINVMLLRALRHPQLFALLREERKNEKAEDGKGAEGVSGAERRKETFHPGDNMPEAEAAIRQRLLLQLDEHMNARRPWLEPDLTLEQLAAQLGQRPRSLSQAINEGLGKSFFELVNQYRISEARRLLTDPPDKKITILEVLYQVGFNSKSSFNTVFKKQTGMTPSEFKKNNGDN